jgi:hypothetical protein
MHRLRSVLGVDASVLGEVGGAGMMAAGFMIGFEWRATFWWGVGCDLKSVPG